MAQQPARHLADLGRRGRTQRCAARLAEGAQVVADDAGAAPVALSAELLEQAGGAPRALVPALVQVGLERVEDAGPSLAGLGQQLLHAAGAGEAPHRLFGQVQLAHDPFDALALGAQCLHRRIPSPGPSDQDRVLTAPRGGLDKAGLSGRVSGRRQPCGLWLAQAAAMARHGLFDVLGEVVPQVPAVSDWIAASAP